MVQVLSKDNLNNAYKRIKRNKGVCSVDVSTIDVARIFIKTIGILFLIYHERTYCPMPVRYANDLQIYVKSTTTGHRVLERTKKILKIYLKWSRTKVKGMF